MTEQFRKVEGLHFNDDEIPSVWIPSGGWSNGRVCTDELRLTVPEARALRDWLNWALPEELTGDST